MIILVNVFTLASAVLFYTKQILPFAFIAGSFLWIFLMISFWFVLPGIVYRRASTFRDHFTMNFEEEGFTVGNERGSRSWSWKELKYFLETPRFFHLYFDATSFFLVPKEGIEGDGVYELRNIIKSHVKKK